MRSSWKWDETRDFYISISFYQSLIALLVDTCNGALSSGGAAAFSGEKAAFWYMDLQVQHQPLKKDQCLLSYGLTENNSCMP